MSEAKAMQARAQPRGARAAVAAVLTIAAALSGCEAEEQAEPDVAEDISVASPAFEQGETIPVEYTCDGADLPPPLAWSGVSRDAAELALLVEDPDAPGGTFTHWAAWGLDPVETALADGLPAEAEEGTNDFGTLGWAGPCPPEDDPPHRYVFRVFAVTEPLELDPGADGDALREAVQDRVVGEGHLEAVYGR